MQYYIYTVNMPDPRAPGDMVGGRLHVVSKKNPTTHELENLSGPKVRIVGLQEPPREWTPADIDTMGPVSKRKMRNKGIVGDLIPDYSDQPPFKE